MNTTAFQTQKTTNVDGSPSRIRCIAIATFFVVGIFSDEFLQIFVRLGGGIHCRLLRNGKLLAGVSVGSCGAEEMEVKVM